MSFAATAALAGIGGGASALASIFNQKYQNQQFLQNLDAQYQYKSKLQEQGIDKTKQANMELNEQQAKLAGANTPASMLAQND